MDNNELALLRTMMKEVIKEELESVKEELQHIKGDISELKEDAADAMNKINMISEWCEAATEYHIHEIHYPLETDEKVR